MATIRSYTTIEQSNVLAKILPIESADMYYSPNAINTEGEVLSYNPFPKCIETIQFNDGKEIFVWSLAALLDVLPNNEHITTSVSRGSWKIEPVEYLPDTWWCEYEDNESLTEFNVSSDNPVDACYEMIIKLHELNLL